MKMWNCKITWPKSYKYKVNERLWSLAEHFCCDTGVEYNYMKVDRRVEQHKNQLFICMIGILTFLNSMDERRWWSLIYVRFGNTEWVLTTSQQKNGIK